MTDAPALQQPPGNLSSQPGKSNGLSVAALVVGIVGVVLAFIPCVNIIGMLLGLIALVLGIIGWVQAGKDPAAKKGTAIAGVVLGVAAIVIAVIVNTLVSAAVTTAAQSAGGKIGQGIEMAEATTEAETLYAKAREAGVDESKIDAAKEKFDNDMATFMADSFDSRAEAETAAAEKLDTLRDELGLD